MAKDRAPKPQIADASDALTKVLQSHSKELRSVAPKFSVNGRFYDATPYLASRYRTTGHSSLFAITENNEHKHFTEEWLADHPGYHYAWVQISDKATEKQATQAKSALRRHQYRFVPETAMSKDTDLPYSTHQSPQGDEWVQVYDVALVCMAPQVFDELFRAKEAMGIAAVADNLDGFYAGVESEGGVGSHEHSVQT